MITTIIVVSSLVLVVVFAAMWLTKPGLRQRVEAPKHLFAEQVRQYDLQHGEASQTAGAQANDES